MEVTEKLLRTPLYDAHVALNARMVPFGGWEMPVQYEGIIAEYEDTRNRVSIFDISHMGEFLIEGDLIESGLDRLVTMRLDDLPVKSSRYGCILNENGGVIDDCIIFRIAEKKWFVVVNGATIEKDAAHFNKHLTDKAKFTNLSNQLGKIDIQGPLSRDVLSALVEGIQDLEYFSFDYFTLLGENNILISRTGYTGELGYEIFFPWDKIEKLWQKLLSDDRVKPAGLGARDILRLEMGYSLYGHELNDETSPLESCLGRFVDLEKEFIGKEVLVQQKQNGVSKKIIGFISDTRRSPRAEQKLFNESEEEIGWVTSGCFSPHLGRGIGLGFVKTDEAKLNSKIYFGTDKPQASAVTSKKIFYKSESIKS